MKPKTNKSSRVISVQMEGVEASVLVPEGDYLVSVKEVECTESQAGKPTLKWVFSVAEGPNKGSTLYYNTSLQPQALFNLKGVLISLGVQVPNSLMKLNLDSLTGLQMGVTVEHEVYEGKNKARITDTFPWDAAGAASGEADEEDEEEVDLDAMELPELIQFAADNGVDLSSLTAKEKKNHEKVKEAIEEALGEDGEEGSEDEGPDLDDMDLKSLLVYANENSLEMKLSLKDRKNVEKVRAAVKKAVAEDI